MTASLLPEAQRRENCADRRYGIKCFRSAEDLPFGPELCWAASEEGDINKTSGDAGAEAATSRVGRGGVEMCGVR